MQNWINIARIVAVITRWFRRRWRPSSVLRDYAAMMALLRALRHDVGARRVLLLRIENCGGILNAGASLSSSVHAESVIDPLEPRLAEWQDMPMTNSYKVDVAHAIDSFPTLHQTVDLQSEELQSIWEADGVHASAIREVCRLRHREFLLVVQMPLGRGDEVEFADRVNRSARLLRQYLVY